MSNSPNRMHDRVSRAYVPISILACMVVFSLSSSGATPERNVEPQEEATNADAFAFAKANNAFAIDMYKALSAQDGNLIFSPFSLSAALAMVHEGARGETASQMETVLHLQPEMHTGNGFALLRHVMLNDSDRLYVLNIANALWYENNFTLDAAFESTLASLYGAHFTGVDFAGAPEEARAAINQWAKEQCADKVGELVPPGAIGPITRIVLANALHFNARWNQAFKEADTKDAPFYPISAKRVDVPTMTQELLIARYFENDEVQVLLVPYKYEAMYMAIVLPKLLDGLAALENSLTSESLLAWIQNAAPQKAELHLPRWKSNSAFEFSKTLSILGMPLAFDGQRADLSGIAGNEDLFVSAVLQNASIDVEEKGTEAAAATAAVLKSISKTVVPPTGPVVFRADHPFLYMILYNCAEKPILFMGRIANPAT